MSTDNIHLGKPGYTSDQSINMERHNMKFRAREKSMIINNSDNERHYTKLNTREIKDRSENSDPNLASYEQQSISEEDITYFEQLETANFKETLDQLYKRRV